MNNFYSAQLQARKIQEDTGMSLDEILKLDMDAYARLTNRPTVGELVAQAAEAWPPGRPRQEPAPAQQPALAPRGIDFAAMDMQTYAQLRSQLIGRSPKEGHGIFDSVGSGSEEYTNAVRAQSGRTAWNNANVVEPPRLERLRYVRQDDQRDTRSRADRFSTPGNAFNL